MLQLSGTLRNASVRITPISSWRMPGQQLLAACSGATNPKPALTQDKQEPVRKFESQKEQTISSKNPMIQSAFDSLKLVKYGSLSKTNDTTTVITPQIEATANVKGLLKMVDEKTIKKEHAFAMVTLLIDWVNNGKAKLSDFELDSRFLHLCELLSHWEKPKIEGMRDAVFREAKHDKYVDELNLFYGINEINEATKEVANITIKQMIKVMSALAQQKRRTTPLLRSLSFNISRSTEVLNIKQLSDLLYSMAVLNYPDEVLLQKVSGDIMQSVKSVEKSVMISSILTSLGILRYKNEVVLDELSEWAVNHATEMRPHEICSFFMTLAMLGYLPTNVESVKKVLIEPLLIDLDMLKPADWLDVVWALTVLDLAQNEHIASVLDSKFIRKLEDESRIPLPKKHKLLNINGAAKLLVKNYKGSLLKSHSDIFKSTILRSKEKQTYAKCVTGVLKNICPDPKYLKTSIDFGMGFLLDAELCIDSEGNRLPIDSNLKEKKGFRIAVIALSYNDFCRGKQDCLGFHTFNFRLLEAKGYTILSIPYTELNLEDKTSKQTAYVNKRIKSIAK